MVVVVVGVVEGVVVGVVGAFSGEQSHPNSGQFPLAHCLVHQASIPG